MMSDLQSLGIRISIIRKNIYDIEAALNSVKRKLAQLDKDIMGNHLTLVDEIVNAPGPHDLAQGKSHPLNEGLTSIGHENDD